MCNRFFETDVTYICLIKIEAFCTKDEDFDQIYLNTGSKYGRVMPRSGKISKVLISKTLNQTEII